MTAAGSSATGRGRMTIGQLLGLLHPDFPDVTISKIRFLEAEGLVEPERTTSGYRKFSHDDLERLRYVLSQQRDHYIPLKVIKQHLDAMGRGLDPPLAAGELPRVPAAQPEDSSPEHGGGAVLPDLRMSAEELVANAGLSELQLDELLAYGLVATSPDSDYFDVDALLVATTVAQLGKYGLEARHLRSFKSAADRQVSLIEQVVAPLARQRDDKSRADASARVHELGVLSIRLHAALVRIGLRRDG